MTKAPAGDGAATPKLRGAARHDLIMATATDLFLEQGYEAVSLDEIIRAVGGSKTNLYKHFGGKEGLLSLVVKEMCEGFLLSLTALDVSTLSPADGLRILATTLLRTLLEDRHIAFQRLMFAVSGRFPELAAVWYESGPGRSRQALAAFIRAKQLSGEMAEEDPRLLAVQFHDMIVSDAIYLSLIGRKPDAAQVDHLIATAIATFLDGRGARLASRS
jgi:AcrR family transcriptional regulator